MTEFASHKPGTFCWVDLTTTDTAGAKKFYSEVFGWEILDIPVGEDMVYTMLNINGKPVTALNQMDESQQKQNFPPYWLSYVSVDDAEDVMRLVPLYGGTVIMDAFPVMDEGVMGVFTDPDGAVLGIWQPKNHIGASYKNIHGALCWNERATHGKANVSEFFENLFGWKAITQRTGEMDYTTFSIDEEMVGGQYTMTPDMSEIPPHWLPYFLINNIDETVAKALNAGGQLLMPKTFAEGVGYFGVIQDPQGGVFGIVEGVK